MTGDEMAAPSSTSPAVFSRAISTPPGLPWDQQRIARLEAARAAPVAISGLTLRLKRLTPWRAARDGKFAAFYVKTESLGGGFRATKVVDGRAVTVEFKSRPQARAEARLLVVFASVGGTATVAGLVAVIAAAAVRHDADQKLNDLVRQSAQQLVQAQVVSAMKRQNTALRSADNPGAPIGEVLGDLAWASRMRRPDVPLEGFHWRPAGFGVEVRGEAQPFAGPEALRATRPLKPGVWLWIKTRGPVPPKPRGSGE